MHTIILGYRVLSRLKGARVGAGGPVGRLRGLLIPHLSNSTAFQWICSWTVWQSRRGEPGYFPGSLVSLGYEGSNHHHGSGHYLHLWLVPKDVIGLTEILSTKQSHFHGDQYPLKPQEVTGFIGCNLISPGLCFLVCKGKGLTRWPPKTPWALRACDLKYSADLIWVFIYSLHRYAPQQECPLLLSTRLHRPQPARASDSFLQTPWSPFLLV